MFAFMGFAGFRMTALMRGTFRIFATLVRFTRFGVSALVGFTGLGVFAFMGFALFRMRTLVGFVRVRSFGVGASGMGSRSIGRCFGGLGSYLLFSFIFGGNLRSFHRENCENKG
jgi:hypothetical protein